VKISLRRILDENSDEIVPDIESLPGSKRFKQLRFMPCRLAHATRALPESDKNASNPRGTCETRHWLAR